jgi:uncharacterized RDD family membrane protein YckC
MEQQSDAAALEFAGFWRRLGAFLLDAVILSALTSPLLAWHGMPHFWDISIAWYLFPLVAISNFLSTVLTIAYYVVFWAWHGQTPGKMIMSVRVIRTDGTGLSLGYSLLRYVGYIISGFFFGLGFLWIAFDARKQGWHDKIAATYVVKVPPPTLTQPVPHPNPSAG